jgi:hypothetical protein
MVSSMSGRLLRSFGDVGQRDYNEPGGRQAEIYTTETHPLGLRPTP